MLLEKNDTVRAIIKRQFKALGLECIECKTVFDLNKHRWNEQGYIGVFSIYLEQASELKGFIENTLQKKITIIGITQDPQETIYKVFGENIFSVLQGKPILAVTANVMASDQDKCFNAGANDFLAKPIQSALLYEKLMRWLPERRVIIQISQQNLQSEAPFDVEDMSWLESCEKLIAKN